MTALSLTKHHGLGNDFLVLLDLEGSHPVDAALARALCDRHRGVGADGLIRVTAGTRGSDVAMELRNADGGLAQTSGNGLRCLAQAVIEAGAVEGPEVVVATAAGPRLLHVRPGNEPREVMVEVEMGPAKVAPEEPAPAPAERAARVDMGNPHLVLLGPPPQTVDVERLGPILEAREAGGLNVEFVAPCAEADQLAMRVWERGVGETLACGSGACAAVAAAHEWGVIGTSVVVHQPGGTARVDLRPETVMLTGPARRVARVEVEI